MGRAMSRTSWSEILAHEVREAVRAHVRHHGLKRGLHLFATRCGISERRAKALYVGEVGRVWADEWRAAMEADGALRRERAAQLRAELADIERGLDAGLALAPVEPRLGVGQ